MKQQKISDLLVDAEHRLIKKGKADYLSDVIWLLCHVLSCSRTELMLNREKVIEKDLCESFEILFQRRLSGEPVQYIIGNTEFYGHIFNVNQHVLIPRFETEELVERAIGLFKKHNFNSFIDMCCGSGCIGGTILKEIPETKGYLIDLSDDAIRQTTENIMNLDLVDRATIIKSDLFRELGDIKVDMIISNPPYIESKMVLKLDEEVRMAEPMMALSGGEDGLDFYRQIVKDGLEYLNENGYLLFEIGYNQGDQVQDLLLDAGYRSVRLFKDLSGKDRIVMGQS